MSASLKLVGGVKATGNSFDAVGLVGSDVLVVGALGLVPVEEPCLGGCVLYKKTGKIKLKFRKFNLEKKTLI